jgi:hypothetical protein
MDCSRKEKDLNPEFAETYEGTQKHFSVVSGLFLRELWGDAFSRVARKERSCSVLVDGV